MREDGGNCEIYKKETKNLLGDYVDCRLNVLISFDNLFHPWHVVPNLQIIL